MLMNQYNCLSVLVMTLISFICREVDVVRLINHTHVPHNTFKSFVVILISKVFRAQGHVN